MAPARDDSTNPGLLATANLRTSDTVAARTAVPAADLETSDTIAAPGIGTTDTIAAPGIGTTDTIAAPGIGTTDTIAVSNTQVSIPAAADMAARGQALNRGTTLGRYVLLDVLGRGGMGVVYAAFDPQLDRKVALKLLHGHLATAGDVLLREGRAIAKLAHPNVVAVYDVGTGADGVFVAMELVEGRSLDHWIAEKARPWRVVLDVFKQAGAGLIAAHSIGMVHRDFKPANVLMGTDGRARVTDFGLARLGSAVEAPIEAPHAEPSTALSSLLSQTGMIVGTPAYMPPEQFAGGRVDATSDQFSFAVALYEALYGERPFAGRSPPEILANIEEGRIRPAPAGAKVPAWVRAAVVRALAPAPADRYPSVADLLAVLGRDPAVRRRWILGGTGGAALLGLGAFALLSMRSDWGTCNITDDALAGVWDASRRAEIESKFTASTAPYARDQLAVVRDGLDRYATAWLAMQQDACADARTRGEQTEDQHAMRSLCLEQRLVDLRAVSQLFANADADVITNAHTTLASLPAIETCGDLRALSARVPPPTSLAMRMRVDALRAQLATARAMGTAGKYTLAAREANRLIPEAVAIGYRPIEAETRVLAGGLEHQAGDVKGAERELTQAVHASEASGDDAATVAAWLTLASARVDLAKLDGALDDVDHAAAVLERFGGDPELALEIAATRSSVLASRGRYADAFTLTETVIAARRGQVPPDPLALALALDTLGIRHSQLGRYKASVAAHREALTLRRSALGDNHPEVARSLHNLGRALIRASEFRDAETTLREALAIRERTLGPNHPEVGKALADVGSVLRQHARYPEALEMYERAIATLTITYGEKHPELAGVLHQIGGNYLLWSKVPEAEQALERGIAMELAVAPDHPDLAVFYGTLAQVQSRLNQPERAFETARKSLAISVATNGPDHPDVAAAHDRLGEMYLGTAKFKESVEAFELSLGIYERSLGANHQTIAVTLSNLCYAYRSIGRPDDATRACTRALAIDEATLGPDHPELSFGLINLAGIHQDAKRYAEATKLYERTLTLRGIENDPRQVVSASFRLAMTLWDGDGDKTRARALMTSANALSVTHKLTAQQLFTAEWLKLHPLPTP